MERIQQPQQLAALIFMAVLAGKRLTLYVLPFSLNGTVIYPLTHVAAVGSPEHRGRLTSQHTTGTRWDAPSEEPGGTGAWHGPLLT